MPDQAITLGPGAMQNWSDHGAGRDAAASPLTRSYLQSLLAGVRRCAVVGPHGADLVLEIARLAEQTTVLTRAINDAQALGAALVDADAVEVFCGAPEVLQDRKFDLVIATGDVATVVSPELPDVTWAEAFATIATLVDEGGRLVLGVENELGLHRLISGTSPTADDGDGDWSVLSTMDASRPRSAGAIAAAAQEQGLSAQTIDLVFPDWGTPSLLVRGARDLRPAEERLLGLLAQRSPFLVTAAGDPDRVLRPALLGGRSSDFCAGWYLVASRGETTVTAADGRWSMAEHYTPKFTPESSYALDGPVRYRVEVEGERVTLVHDGDSRRTSIGSTDELLSESLLQACARYDVATLRTLMKTYRSFIDGLPDSDPSLAWASPDNLVVSGDDLYLLTPGTGASAAGLDRVEVFWHGTGRVVTLLLARSVRNPWPATTDPGTILQILGAMAGFPAVPAGTEPARYLTALDSLPFGSDIAGARARVRRLEARNSRLSTQVAWLEKRLNERETQLRGLNQTHARQIADVERREEELRTRLTNYKNSITARTGRAVLSPALGARALARRARGGTPRPEPRP